MRLAAHRRRDALLEQPLDLARLHVGPQARAQVDRGGLAQRHDRGGEHDVVRDHDRVLALREGRVEQAERGHDALDLAGQAARLQAHALADLERPRGDQHHAGDQVAERLLGRETEDDRGDGAADGQRARRQPGDPQRHQRRDDQEDQPDQEADGAGRRGIHAPEQRGRDEAADVAGQRAAEGEQQRPPRRRGPAGRARTAPRARCRRRSSAIEQRHDHEQLAARPAGALRGLQRQRAGASAARCAGRSVVVVASSKATPDRLPGFSLL